MKIPKKAQGGPGVGVLSGMGPVGGAVGDEVWSGRVVRVDVNEGLKLF